MKNEKTTWSSPKTNIFAGINDLRKAHSSGYNAVLVKEYNQNCSYPILTKLEQDFRQYKFSHGTVSTRKEIMNDKNLLDYSKYLSLNYVCEFAKSKEAIEHYYNNGVLSIDNIGNIGRAHLVKVTDLIDLLRKTGDNKRADMYYKQYICPSGIDTKHFFDFFTTDRENILGIKNIKQKLWVVELHDKNVKLNLPIHQKILIKILNAFFYPLKYIPRKSILKMPEYTVHSFRVGSVVNGIKIEIQIPKKFSFK